MRELLERAGFLEIEEQDVTAEYRETAAELLVRQDEFKDALRSVGGSKPFDERQRDLGRALAAIDDGILSRSLFVARVA